MNKYSVSDKENHVTSLWAEGGEGHFTNYNEMYQSLFKNVFGKQRFGNILEIGAGDGSFAEWVMDANYGCVYYFLDIPAGINLLRSKFGDEAFYIPSSRYKALFNSKFNLIISNNCLSETPSYYRDFIIEQVLPSCPNLFVIDGDPNIKGYHEKILNALLPRGVSVAGNVHKNTHLYYRNSANAKL